MSIAALINEGVGPGGSILYMLTEGLDIGAVPPSPPPPPPPPPIVSGALPHDDYDRVPDGFRPWWQQPRDFEARRLDRLRQMREEIGLVQKPDIVPDAPIEKAARAVEKAARLIATKPAETSEDRAFKYVKGFEREFKKALKPLISDDMAEEIWREEVRHRLIETSNEEMLLILAAW